MEPAVQRCARTNQAMEPAVPGIKIKNLGSCYPDKQRLENGTQSHHQRRKITLTEGGRVGNLKIHHAARTVLYGTRAGETRPIAGSLRNWLEKKKKLLCEGVHTRKRESLELNLTRRSPCLTRTAAK